MLPPSLNNSASGSEPQRAREPGESAASSPTLVYRPLGPLSLTSTQSLQMISPKQKPDTNLREDLTRQTRSAQMDRPLMVSSRAILWFGAQVACFDHFPGSDWLSIVLNTCWVFCDSKFTESNKILADEKFLL